MDNPVVVVILTLAAVIVIKIGVALLLSGGNMGRIMLATRAALKILRDQKMAEKVDLLLNPPPPTPDKPDARPIRLLSVLQREGRLLDFLMEDIATATDEQIAAGVREIHRDCQKVIKEHLELAPIFSETEGEKVTVKSGFDPSAIQLTGNVTGEPPFKGELQHAGWRVNKIHLAEPAEGVDELVIQPAEVELK